ncbi:Restriction modification system DNA specificity domain [Croceitalea dokdonensis DOKDO 023]|uniref:Restriction modification system DNA specificity domain n=1 Tax=Croceitalea dokdonensis DOKDO 023 TaxID=1300341 RepID=A0A0P7AE51_9FLAO|nr:Restriction modification system DNA specificity domain [Croceitalea dokdonensis DOKDO 023]
MNYENGSVKNIHYGDIHTKFSTHFDILKEDVPFINPETSIDRIDKDNYCKEGDLVIADASEDIDDIGKSIEIINLNKEKLLAGLHTFLARPIDSKITIGFGGHLFKSSGIVTQIKKEAQGAKVLGISKGRLANLDVYFPTSPKEQQKIAACLSSLDEVITAETEKLDLLQDHKKGLLQQLFPNPMVNGETMVNDETHNSQFTIHNSKVPKFRFPEFVNDGDWEEHKLKKLLEFQTGYPFKSKGFNDENKGIRLIKNRDLKADDRIVFFEGSFDKSYLVDDGDILVGMDGDFSPIKWNKGKALLNQRVGRIRTENDTDDFFYYFLSIHLKIVEHNTPSTTVKHLSHSTVEKLEIPIPPSIKEQQTIAACLSAADELIAAQTQKIEQLQEHKKGLLQQLFPNHNP